MEKELTELKDTSINKTYKNVVEQSRFEGSFVYLAAVAASMNVLGMGIASAFTSSTSESLESPKTGIDGIGSEEIEWIAAIVQMCAIPGALLSGYLSNLIGRHTVLMYTSVLFVISWLIVAYANTIGWIYVGRAINGICTGLVTVTIPAYLTEISIPENRGRLGTFIPAAFCTGLFCGMSLGLLITWRWLALLGAGISTLAAILLIFVPESPSWLLTQNYKYKALKALKLLRGNDEKAVLEFRSLSDFLLQNQKQQQLKCSEFTSPVLYKPLLLGLALIFFQQFNGLNAIIAYTKTIFSQAGGSLNPTQATLIVAGVQVPSNILSTLVIERAGRRVFHVLSGIIMAIGLLSLGIFTYFSSKDSTLNINFGWMPLVGCVMIFVGLALGYGPIPFIMITEMTSQHARSVVVGIATITLYIVSFTVAKTFGSFQNILGNAGVYFMYSAVAFSGVIFGLIFLPETRGKSLQEIQKYFIKDVDEIPFIEKENSTERL